jgi:uncharacterized glyoxalase superfamily protein PhnB
MAQTVTPYLLYEDGEAAIAFAERAFGFREIDRTTGSGGGLHVELETGSDGGRIYVGQPGGGFRNPAKVGRTALIYVLVEDVDAHYERAQAAGARILQQPTDMPFGARQYGCADPEGHEWYFAQPIGD